MGIIHNSGDSATRRPLFCAVLPRCVALTARFLKPDRPEQRIKRGPFIPAHRRTNFLIADEIDIGMDKLTRLKFVNDFLPELNKIIPTIVLITPHGPEDFYVPHAREYLVTKKNGVSTMRVA